MKIFVYLKNNVLLSISGMIYICSLMLFLLAPEMPYRVDGIMMAVSYFSLPLITYFLMCMEAKLRFKNKTTWFIAALASLAISFLTFFGVSFFLSFGVILAYGVLILKDFFWHIFVWIGVYFLSDLWLAAEKDKERNKQFDAMERETLIVDIVDKQDPADIKVAFKDKGIFTFEAQLGQQLLKAGDTVQVVIYDHRVVRLER